MAVSVSNGIVSASSKVILVTLDRSLPMNMNRNPVTFDFNSRMVISSSRSTLCYRDEDRVSVNDSNGGVFIAIVSNKHSRIINYKQIIILEIGLIKCGLCESVLKQKLAIFPVCEDAVTLSHILAAADNYQ